MVDVGYGVFKTSAATLVLNAVALGFSPSSRVVLGLYTRKDFLDASAPTLAHVRLHPFMPGHFFS